MAGTPFQVANAIQGSPLLSRWFSRPGSQPIETLDDIGLATEVELALRELPPVAHFQAANAFALYGDAGKNYLLSAIRDHAPRDFLPLAGGAPIGRFISTLIEAGWDRREHTGAYDLITKWGHAAYPQACSGLIAIMELDVEKRYNALEAAIDEMLSEDSPPSFNKGFELVRQLGATLHILQIGSAATDFISIGNKADADPQNTYELSFDAARTRILRDILMSSPKLQSEYGKLYATEIEAYTSSSD